MMSTNIDHNYFENTQAKTLPASSVAVDSRLFTSYAQNFEDVMIRRVFPKSDGFYIDVGAQHPKKESVTYAFYQKGWRGINIEPSPYYARLLRQKRPRDTNLCLAANEYNGEIQFHELVGTGLSTFKADFAQRAVASGFQERIRTVPCATLDRICRDHQVTQVDFLKIDVEGAEDSVLRGFSLTNIRPILLIIEATEPRSQVTNHHLWEPGLLNHGYQMVYNDGLNRFYLAHEHRDLSIHFQYPPNVHDRFVRSISFRDVATQIMRTSPNSVLNRFKSLVRQARRLTPFVPGR